jgi:adenylate cyclase
MSMWRSLKLALWKWRSPLIATPAVVGMVLLLRGLGLLQSAEWSMYDQFMQARSPAPLDQRIVIVGIYETDIQRYGWPLSDGQLAVLLAMIQEQNPRAIGLDLYRDQPVGEGTDALNTVFRSNPNLIGIQKIVGDDRSESVPPPPVLQELGQVSANDMVVDADGTLRRGLLSLTDDSGRSLLGLGFTMALLYLEAEEMYPNLTDDERIQLGSVVLDPFEHSDGGYVQANDAGYQLLLNYRGPAGAFLTVSIEDVLNRRTDPNLFRDRIVFVGATAESLRDFFYTPYNRNADSSRPMPGVEAQANITSQIIGQVLDQRSPIRTWSMLTEYLWIAGWTAMGTLIAWRQRHRKQQEFRWFRIPGQLQILGLVAIASGGLIGGSYIAFGLGWWIPVVPSLLGMGTGAIAIVAHMAQSASDLRRTFGRYITDEVVSTLLETPEGLHLGGQRRCISVLMSDVRGFTLISEQLAPEAIVALLNIYLTEMSNIVDRYGGVINEIIGDGLVVFFGAPTEHSDHAERAIACAIAMQAAMSAVNQRLQDEGLPAIEMGIGINTGDVVIGNIGSQQHTKYTAIGSQVNLASRIETASVGGQVLISEQCCRRSRSPLTIQQRLQIELKGISDPIWIYDVTGIGEPYNITVGDRLDHHLTSLDPAIPVQYMLVDGKRITGISQSGALVRLSDKEAELRCNSPIAPFTNLRLTLLCPENPSLLDCYAKVLHLHDQDALRARIYFTSLSPAMKILITQLTQSSP